MDNEVIESCLGHRTVETRWYRNLENGWNFNNSQVSWTLAEYTDQVGSLRWDDVVGFDKPFRLSLGVPTVRVGLRSSKHVIQLVNEKCSRNGMAGNSASSWTIRLYSQVFQKKYFDQAVLAVESEINCDLDPLVDTHGFYLSPRGPQRHALNHFSLTGGEPACISRFPCYCFVYFCANFIYAR